MRLVALVVIAVLATTPLAAQAPGARIRVGTADGRTQIGQLVALDADSVRVVDRTGTEHRYARADLRRLEISAGRRHNFGRHIARGALIGAGGGFLIGVLASTEDESSWGSPCDGAECVPIGTAIGAVWGVLIGGVVGAVTTQEKWQRLEAAPVQPEVRPVARGMSVGLRVRF